ncbi:MBL fold metallo-hydrolase [candidate division KSB1 bacterium]|nr:MBL fold metallo-hydrolase [candidate division KSB1 bacterium]
MHKLTTQISLLLVALMILPLVAQAGEKNAKSIDCGKLLKGVAHFTDNDVRFKTKDSIVIFIDPMSGPEKEIIKQCNFITPDLILITHAHSDHFQMEILKAYSKINPKVIIAGPPDIVQVLADSDINNTKSLEPGKDYSLADVKFETVPAYFLRGDSHPKANGWMGYILKINNARYYVTGDTEAIPEMESITADVLFPLVYGCGGNVANVVKMAKIIKPALVVPVHTGGNPEAIKKCIDAMPKGVASTYFIDGKMLTEKIQTASD